MLVDGDMLINKENLHLWESGQYMASDQTWGSFPVWRNPISLGIAPDIQSTLIIIIAHMIYPIIIGTSPQIYQWILDSVNEIMSRTCLRFDRIYAPINGPYMLVKLSGRLDDNRWYMSCHDLIFIIKLLCYFWSTVFP